MVFYTYNELIKLFFKVSPKSFPLVHRSELTTLQINIGYKCNQKCTHCHVNAGPDRWEMMGKSTINLIPKVIELYEIKNLDITGGAPELHRDFKSLVKKTRDMGVQVIDRCNLTILSEPGQEDLAAFLAKHKVIVVASLPCYEENNVDRQRGKGVFHKSILGLKLLNRYGYGHGNGELILNLVYNPQGPNLPPDQKRLEEDYKHILLDKYGIVFDNLFTLANMPIKRFARQLMVEGEFESYKALLLNSYNPINLDNIMCRSLISVDWQGNLFDCDFNQQLGIDIGAKPKNLIELLNYKQRLDGNVIKVGDHCYGCTAGKGSSCSGSLN